MSRRRGHRQHPRVTCLRPDANRPHYVLRWREADGRGRQRSTSTADGVVAREQAVELSRRLHDGHDASGVTWVDFCSRYEREHASLGSPRTFEAWRTARNWYYRLMLPASLGDITSSQLSSFLDRLRQALIDRHGRARETTIAVYLRHLLAAFRWAAFLGLLPEAPRARLPRRPAGCRGRGRPLSEAEFQQLLATVPRVRPGDWANWQRYLRGLWLSGLRLSESLLLSWDSDASFSVDLCGRYPRFRIWAEAEKSHRDRLLPMTPDFAEWLLAISDDSRTGTVFALGRSPDSFYGPRSVGRIIAAIGRAAGIIVNRAMEKYATAHDLRRSFATRWAPRVKPVVLRQLMRHRSIKTTLAYYVDLDADELAESLWRDHEPSALR